MDRLNIDLPKAFSQRTSQGCTSGSRNVTTEKCNRSHKEKKKFSVSKSELVLKQDVKTHSKIPDEYFLEE